MARPENPVDPNAGPLHRFAYDLRRLRDLAGRPSYRAMAASTGVSATTLSEAASGRRRPSLRVVLAYVDACDGDRDQWRRRWCDLPMALQDTYNDEPGEASADAEGTVRAPAQSGPIAPPAERSVRRLAALVAVAAALSVVAIGMQLAALLLTPG